MAARPVVLILGAGPRVGASVADKFASIGYKVAIASRTGTNNAASYLSIKADFAKPDSIPALFDTVKNELHASPSVVIYNAAALTPPPNKDSVFSISVENVANDLNVNTISPYVAAQQAISGWETLPKDTKKTFIFTGNILNTTILPYPAMQNLGMGKAASAYWIGFADTSYSTRGYRFFYADQRQEDGNWSANLDGGAHAEFFAQLASHEENLPWHVTFVKGKGYVQFK